MNLATTTLEGLVRSAIATVFDPEYPGVSVVELGLLESVTVETDGEVRIGMIPTYSGCPALKFIAADVETAVKAVAGVSSARVDWLRSPVWSQDRVSPSAVKHLERDFTVTLRRADGTLRCPVCGSDAVKDTSPMGPSRCRSLAYCPDCLNPIEVMR